MRQKMTDLLLSFLFVFNKNLGQKKMLFLKFFFLERERVSTIMGGAERERITSRLHAWRKAQPAAQSPNPEIMP